MGLGFDTYSYRNPFDPIGRINNKPSISLIFAFLGISVNDAIWIGSILISLFILQSISLLRETKLIFLMLGALCIFNPNILFAIERCNDDIIIFIFCFGLPYLISRNHVLNSIAICLIWFLTALKYYPFILYTFFIFNRIAKLKIYLFFIILINIAWLNISLNEILFLKQKLPKTGTNLFSFSLNDLFKFWYSSHYLLIILFLVSTILCYLYLKTEQDILSKRLLKVSVIDKKYFIIGSTLLTVCYLVSHNWSYRLIHSIFLLPIILKLLSNTKFNSLKFRYEKFLITVILSLAIGHWSYIAFRGRIKFKDNF